MTSPSDTSADQRIDDDDDGKGERINRTARFAWGAVVVLLAFVIGLVIYALAGPSSSSPAVVRPARTSSAIVSTLGRVPAPVFDSVGVTASAALTAPTLLTHQPPLQSKGKPEVLFVGSEFCAFCAAERWPLIVALSRFGRFETLDDMQSASQSVFAGVQTFSFFGSEYTSPYVTLTGVELYSDSVDRAGGYARIASLTPAQSAVVERYVDSGEKGLQPGTFPFVDIDNLTVTSTSGFSPAVIDGRSQAAIAADLSQPLNPVGRAIVASANYLTAGICRADAGRPASVCDSKGVELAARALRVS
jgi:Domain of unknown function (DUF929)